MLQFTSSHSGVAFFDCCFLSNGLLIAASDSYGQLTLYGFGQRKAFKNIPRQQFFHNDFHDIEIKDNRVIDRISGLDRYLLPPPFLVKFKGFPHKPEIQRLVPGRENLDRSLLIPHVLERFITKNDGS